MHENMKKSIFDPLFNQIHQKFTTSIRLTLVFFQLVMGYAITFLRIKDLYGPSSALKKERIFASKTSYPPTEEKFELLGIW